MSGNQRRLGFRVVYCHVQLSGIDIYIKLHEGRKKKDCKVLHSYVKTIESER